MQARTTPAQNLKTALWALSAALLVLGCSQRDPRFALLGRSQGFLAKELNKKVDILWVIDNSGSMGPKQTNLANSINAFMSSFVNKGFDYQIAVVTTDTRTVLAGGQGSCFVGAPLLITPSTPNPVAALAANANVGNFGDAAAKGLDASLYALTAPNSTGCNSSFLRPDAYLAVIYFSDADDNDSVNSVSDVVAGISAVKPPIASANGASIRSFFLSAMVSPDHTTAACQALGPFTETGLKFLDAANRTGGIVANICEPDFSAGLLAVATRILEKTTAVHLATVPEESTIVVIVNGATIAKDNNNGWTYDPETTSIVFHGDAIPSGVAYITVNYTPYDIIR